MLRDRLIYALTACIMLAACGPIVPATVPAQLAHTPDAPVILSETRVEAETFSSAYPDGWRIVKASEAGAPVRLVLVSPDDSLSIVLAEGSVDADDGSEGMRSERMTVTLADDGVVTVIGQAPDEAWDDFQPVLAYVASSISAR